MGYTVSQFVERLRDKCKQNPGSLALPEFADERVQQAATRLCTEGVVREIHVPCERKALPASFTDNQKIKCADDDRAFFTEEDDTPLLQAGTLLRLGVVDAVLAGAVVTTADVIRAAISSVGVAPGMKTISGSFLMNREHPHLTPHTFLYADSGVVIEPTEKQLVDIAVASVGTWRQLVPDTPPHVAFLSFSTKGSAHHELATKMSAAAAAFQQKMPDVATDGELQFDAALLPDIAARKCPDSAVAGRANIFIFPNLDAGNIAYKITQRLGEFEAYGPILQGAGKPFSDLSRGATTDDIVASAYINLLRAMPAPALA